MMGADILGDCTYIVDVAKERMECDNIGDIPYPTGFLRDTKRRVRK